MVDWLWRWVRGWVEVFLQGPHQDRVLSELAMAGYRLWAVRRQGAKTRVIMDLSGLGSLHHIALQYRLGVRFGHRGGLPLMMSRVRLRPFLWMGAVSALAVVWVASHRIWLVDAPDSGLSLAAREQVIEVAKTAGLALGTPIGQLQIARIRATMLRDLPQYSWIGIERQGVLARIRVIPVIHRPAPVLGSHMVAAASGKVLAIETYMGEPTVAVGDYVQKGQVLITGSPTGNGSPTHPDQVVALGQIWAEVPYTVKVFQPYRDVQWRPTKRRFVMSELIWAHHRAFTVQGWGKVPFAHYHMAEHTSALFFRGVLLPMEWKQIVYNEETERVTVLSRQKALAQAMAKAETMLFQTVPPEAVRLGQTRTVKVSRHGVWVTLRWQMRQNIAQMPATVSRNGAS